jgi:hypothetical protein
MHACMHYSWRHAHVQEIDAYLIALFQLARRLIMRNICIHKTLIFVVGVCLAQNIAAQANTQKFKYQVL